MKKSTQDGSRRNFLKKGLTAAAGFYIVPRHVLGGKGFIAPSDRLIIAAVGIGGKGEVDINYLSGSGNADIAVLCECGRPPRREDQGKIPLGKILQGLPRDAG